MLLDKLLKTVFPAPIVKFKKLREKASGHPPKITKGNVIILPFRINPSAQWFEFIIGYALRLRGYQPIIGMGERAIRYTDGYLCTNDRWLSRQVSLFRAWQFSNAFQLELSHFDQLLGEPILKKLREEAWSAPKSDIARYHKYGVDVGKQVMGSLSRYYLKCRVDVLEHEEISREFLYTALVSLEAAKAIIDKYDPALLISSHGIYSSWGTFTEYFRIKGYPFVTWGFQYKKHAFLLSHNKSYHRDIIEEPATQWREYELRDEQREILIDYINSKGSANHSDNINYYSANAEDRHEESLKTKLGINHESPVFGLFPNLSWDAQVSFRSLFFEDMNDWMLATIRWFSTHPTKTLIIRAHPAEIRGLAETKEKAADIVAREFPQLPKNVFLIAPDSSISSYDVLKASDACLVYGSKFGLEAAINRIPLIVCGEAYFRDKGISYDPDCENDYYQLLDKAPSATPVTDSMYERALHYGYHYNFRRQFILPLAEMNGPVFKDYLFESASDLAPGKNIHMDRLLEYCFTGKPFIDPGSL